VVSKKHNGRLINKCGKKMVENLQKVGSNFLRKQWTCPNWDELLNRKRD
jgi:hypothetical protein